jgi:hypothetical protein
MAGTLKIAGWVYLAFALVWLGIQIPIRLETCSGLGCLATLLTAPVWAVIWPVYWPLSDVFPRLITVALIVLTAPIFAAALLVGPWQRWAETRLGQAPGRVGR